MSEMPIDRYPGALWTPAHASNYRTTSRRTIKNICIHCTDGRGKALPVTQMWQEPNHGSSAHFVIDQSGAVYQAVSISDVAFHAHSANSYSVGIEHCARTPGELGTDDPGLPPSTAQYAASAALVAWLCGAFRLKPDRTTIQGHAEIDLATTHRRCPDGCGWDWSRYMGLVAPRIT